MKAVILDDGLWKILPYTTFLSKPMSPLGEKQILEHLIDRTKKNRVKSIVLCVSYLRKTIEDGTKFGVNIEYAVSNKPLATAGQLKTAEEFIDNTFIYMYGD